jgi:hypothetical protein
MLRTDADDWDCEEVKPLISHATCTKLCVNVVLPPYSKHY